VRGKVKKNLIVSWCGFPDKIAISRGRSKKERRGRYERKSLCWWIVAGTSGYSNKDLRCCVRPQLVGSDSWK